MIEPREIIVVILQHNEYACTIASPIFTPLNQWKGKFLEDSLSEEIVVHFFKIMQLHLIKQIE